jgi:flagella basal body P-ring formation protein FlgA
MARHTTLLLSALITALIACAAPDAHALTVRENTTIDRDKVLVGDVFSDVDASVAAQPVGDAPAPGRSHTFDVYALKRIAKAYNIDWMPVQLDLKSVVRRDSTVISTSQISDTVREAVAEKAQAAGLSTSNLDIVLDRRNLEINLPANVQSPAVRIVDMRYNPIDYRFSGTLMVETGKETAEPVMMALAGRAIPNIKVPVLVRHISSGSVIADGDLDYILMPVNKVSGDIQVDTARLVGKELRRDMAEGQPLRAQDVRAQQLVKRGSMVTMVIEKGSLRVTAQGRALADAGIGDNVRIVNSITSRVIEGTVLPDGNVAIATAI